jgi:hypothetical protein
MNDKRSPRLVIAAFVLLGVIGIGWDVLAAAILFHSYSFFESVVVCLLVMILCGVATVRADVELGVFSEDVEDKDSAERKASKLIRGIRSHVQVLFYAIAFLMA